MATEKRLIDANALIDYFRREHHESEDIWAVENAPTVDAVEVVRCRDCLYWEEYDGEMFCLCDANLMTDTAADDFCSYGERRTDV